MDFSWHLHACIALYIVFSCPWLRLSPIRLHKYHLMLSSATREQDTVLMPL